TVQKSSSFRAVRFTRVYLYRLSNSRTAGRQSPVSCAGACRSSGAIEAVKRRGRRRPVGAVGGVAAGNLVGTPGGRRVKGSTIGTGRLGWRNDCRCASTVCR